ncbi:MAG: hypothetical protein FVQ85_21795 [Planctomycetes bacterium]|nr:hypothetical protein [Planctomycetota bacterium]
MSNKSVLSIPSIVQELYSIVDRLEELFPGRRFTPDGHLVGSIGEVLAAAGKLQKNGQRPISLYKLRRLMKSVQKPEQLRRSTS